MTNEIALFLAIFGAALVLFFFEWFPADVVALGLMLTLILTGLIPSETAFQGFGSEVALMILGLLIMTAALEHTGVVDIVGRWLQKRTGSRPIRLLAIIMVVPGLIGIFMSNTASTAFFLPITIGLAERARISPSKILMPLAFAGILGSSVTLVSTSTNILVSGLMRQNGLRPIGMFELSPVGIPIFVIGIAYMLFVGQRLIPNRGNPHDQSISLIDRRRFLTEIVVLPNSSLIGSGLTESGLESGLKLKILQVTRNNVPLMRFPDLKLQENDILLIEGGREEVLRVLEAADFDLKENVRLRAGTPETSLQEADSLVEVVILPRSPLIGRTLKGVSFREAYKLKVIAINRSGETIHNKISHVALRMGDILLLQGSRRSIRALEDENFFNVLTVIDRDRPQMKRAPLAMALFVGAILLATFNVVSIAVAVLIGAFGVFITRCITPEEAYREVEWKAIILIGSMLAFGAAMSETGTADYVAMQMVDVVGDSAPILLLAIFFWLSVLLTQPMSNQAAAVVLIPVAIQTARQLGLDPRSFAITIAVAASTSYMTPLEPACLMVYGAGQYKFIDFVKVGTPLTVIIFLITIILVPVFWPL
jgi:di/tricarboxylate transporter